MMIYSVVSTLRTICGSESHLRRLDTCIEQVSQCSDSLLELQRIHAMGSQFCGNSQLVQSYPPYIMIPTIFKHHDPQLLATLLGLLDQLPEELEMPRRCRKIISSACRQISPQPVAKQMTDVPWNHITVFFAVAGPSIKPCPSSSSATISGSILRFLQKSRYASPVVPPAALPTCQSRIPGLIREKTILSLLHSDVVEHRPGHAVDDMLLIVLWAVVASCPSC